MADSVTKISNRMIAGISVFIMMLTISAFQSAQAQDKTKQECAWAIRYVLSRPEMIQELEKSRKLPIRAVAAGSGVSRKVLDRYRKYIIMGIQVLNGDYPQLAEYLKFVRKEGAA